MASRVGASMRLDPPPALPGPDELDRTARQVYVDRYDELPIHALRGEPYGTAWGRQYRTVCDTTLAAADGAMLTTREATCGSCLAGGR